MATLTFLDETMTGRVVAEGELLDLPVTASVREIVRSRVREEVARLNAAPDRHRTGPAPAGATELVLNGYGRTTPPRDWEAEARAAEEAFARNGFVVLVDDHQVEDLDEVVDLRAEPRVAFVRLVPLAGG